jgi:hypothetical protein
MDLGIKNASARAVSTPLPISWLGRADAPLNPTVLNIPQLTNTNIKNLQAQIGYDQSGWDYTKIGTNNQLGRYQFSTTTLEAYGLLATGSNLAYGTDCVNYSTCWRPVTIRKNSNSYANYNYNITNLNGFLTSVASQEHLAYQVILDNYTGLLANGGILESDSADTVSGMIYVGWVLGVGTQPTTNNLQGTGAYAWRYASIGDGINAFNSGRYAVVVLG